MQNSSRIQVKKNRGRPHFGSRIGCGQNRRNRPKEENSKEIGRWPSRRRSPHANNERSINTPNEDQNRRGNSRNQSPRNRNDRFDNNDNHKSKRSDDRKRTASSSQPDVDKSINAPNSDQTSGGSSRNNRFNATDPNRRRNDNRKRKLPYRVEDRQNPKKVRQMGFNFLEDLLKNENLEEIIFVLNNDKKGFKELLESRQMSSDTIVLILQLLCRICECSFQSSKIELFESALTSAFAHNVVNFVSTIAVQTNHEKRISSSFWKNTDQFWNNIILVARNFQDIIPTSSCEVMAKLLKAVKLNIPIIESSHSIHISDTIKNDVEQLFKIVEKTSTEVERKKEISSIDVQKEELEPPDDFRQISVYPSAVEVTLPESPFLRPNVTKGPYRDVDHYLDVQFRLLREDFVAPLRKAICRYMNNPKDKLDDVKIYNPVQFLNRETVTEQNCFRIQYDFSKRRRAFQYENSRRFMFGALLCFTSDNFKTVLFGKVVKRDVEDLLSIGQLIVGFSEDVDIPENIYDLEYVMVESTVYFEPYYRVLNVLKTMQRDKFPMERYIIRVETTNRPPSYLLKPEPKPYTIENVTISPFAWGEKRFYGLNDSQNEAFKAALTREFSIIQGPPGTGKTFLGLKIAHTLLRNQSVWYKKTPILVICYTNHALDQFLEGLLTVTKQVLRVGGQSKNEHLNNYNIRKMRLTANSNPAIAQRRHNVMHALQEISTINKYLSDVEKNDCIVEFGVFRGVVPNFHGSWFDNAKKEDILNWLFSGDEVSHRYAEMDRQMQQRSEHIRKPDEEAVAEKVEELMDVEDGELVDEVFENIRVTGFEELVSLKTLNDKVNCLMQELKQLSTDDRTSYWGKIRQKDRLNFEIYRAESELEYLQMRLVEGANNRAPPRFFNLMKPHYMSPDDRWQLYFYWLGIYVAKLRERREALSREFRKVYSVYTELRDMEDTQIMKNSLVVGMTTTGAARLQSSLQSLKSPIVIVEEAAEVLETHIISSLTSHCKHLILIGDHQQLKPSTANFKIKTKYQLGISLFERMVINKIECHTLKVQHRMRPEISCLIRPSIYPVLEDDKTVMNRPQIHGIEKCVYFLDHEKKEQLCKDNSKKNEHEAKFLVQLARYLILNGYRPEDITILAAYLGQMYELQREKKLYSNLLQDVRVAVLDNYQGEESDIILLSLVRSNSKNDIGFLKTENRVCVALSRARNGFYIMGNMKQLCNNSEIWPKIRESLKSQDAIGPYISLYCQVHRNKIKNVRKAEDFSSIIEGGCDLLCEEKLGCGHICKRLCHVQDRKHINYECREKCVRVLCKDPTHICRKLCHEDCGSCTYIVNRDLQCGHSVKIDCFIDPMTYKCMKLVSTSLPCGHEAERMCHVDPETFRCPHPCENRVEPCGHSCIRKCHIKNDPDHLKYKCMKACQRHCEGCTQKNDESHLCQKLCYEDCPLCDIQVLKKRDKCNHFLKTPCFQDPNTIKCQELCLKPLPCGHKCKMHCDEPCGNCKELVEKTVPNCNHTIKIECSKEPDRKYCQGICPRRLPCGHGCLKKCEADCTTECRQIVDCSISSPCGHVLKKIPCFLKDTKDPKILLQRCSEPCAVKLKCEHVCQGTCGECSRGRIHKKCQEKCGVVLVCNHECPIPCRQACKPCLKPCEYRCKHSKCARKCGDPCTSCKEPCERKCEHQVPDTIPGGYGSIAYGISQLLHEKCTRRCGQICNVPACVEPCKKKLKCGHACVGFCGDRCPVLCKICDRDELTHVFLGREDEEDAIYVMLEDCKHIFDYRDLGQWLRMDEDEIKAKVCPRCKTTILTTARYSSYIRRSMTDIIKVKRKFFGDDKDNINEGQNISSELLKLKDAVSVIGGMKVLESAIKNLLSRLSTSRDNPLQTINRMDLDAIKSKVQILASLIKLFWDRDQTRHTPDRLKKLRQSVFSQCSDQISFIVNAVMRDKESITDQEIEDVTLEIERLTRLSQFEQMKKSIDNNNGSKEDVVQQVSKISVLLDSPTRFSSELDETLTSEMEKLKKLTASPIQISDAERIAIVKAIGLSPGHWYKCPNGHPYAIADCGGAMQVSKCNECGVAIGGTQHRLLPGNAVATEMDGARHAAWSEAANMGNYML